MGVETGKVSLHSGQNTVRGSVGRVVRFECVNMLPPFPPLATATLIRIVSHTERFSYHPYFGPKLSFPFPRTVFFGVSFVFQTGEDLTCEGQRGFTNVVYGLLPTPHGPHHVFSIFSIDTFSQLCRFRVFNGFFSWNNFGKLVITPARTNNVSLPFCLISLSGLLTSYFSHPVHSLGLAPML